MHAEIKYLSLGLFVGLGITSLLVAGMLVPRTVTASLPTDTPTITSTSTLFFTSPPQPSPTPTAPTNTYTPTPTLIHPSTTPTITNTPTVTPTVPSPTPTLSGTMLDLFSSGTLLETGPLNIRQHIQLYNTSLNYVRETNGKSRILGEQINGKGYGSPSDICGPLSISILQEAGIIDADIDPHSFWLLNPDVRDDRRLITKAFPPEKFETFRARVKLDKVDWNINPLYPGDFIYIYAGSGGNFEHMLVVSRIDAEGRAYAVTNRNTENGFIISEVLLYHPAKSNVGMFSVWTERPNKLMGATGFDGFEVWRLRAP